MIYISMWLVKANLYACNLIELYKYCYMETASYLNLFR